MILHHPLAERKQGHIQRRRLLSPAPSFYRHKPGKGCYRRSEIVNLAVRQFRGKVVLCPPAGIGVRNMAQPLAKGQSYFLVLIMSQVVLFTCLSPLELLPVQTGGTRPLLCSRLVRRPWREPFACVL